MAEDRSVSWTSVGVAIVILAILGWIVGTREAKTNDQETRSGTETGLEQELFQTSVVNTIAYEGQDGKTVLELLQTGHQVELQESDLGVLVLTIDGQGGDPDTFWLYYIDGQPAEMSADKVVTKNGQNIEWRYEKF